MDERRASGRQANYDLLRILCTVAVIAIHISGIYKTAITDPGVFGALYAQHMPDILLYNTLSRFAVPCFVMLSGAFLLANDRNAEYRSFYKRSFKKIGIPTLIFSVFYFLYSELRAALSVAAEGQGLSLLLEPVKSALRGEPYGHMWYLYMLIGVYIAVPLLIEFKNRIGEAPFFKLSCILFVVSIAGGWTSHFKLQWSLCKSVCYLGYLVMGYQCRRILKKDNARGILLIALGVLVELALTYVVYRRSLRGIADAGERYSLVGEFNPLVATASLLIFAGFSKITLGENAVRVDAGKLFLIYLFHCVVWSLVPSSVIAPYDCRIVLPLYILAVYAVSWVLSLLYQRIWARIDREGRVSNGITEMICRLVR